MAKSDERSLQEIREKALIHYKDSIPFLKIQLEYETLLTDIETQQAKRLQAQTMIANIKVEKKEEKK